MICFSWESITALATALLAVITGLLAFYTYKLWRATVELARDASANSAMQFQEMRTSLEIAKKAADAADMSARAAIGVELPVIRAIPQDLVHTSELIPPSGPYGGGIDDGPPSRYMAVGLIEFQNHGRTVARPEVLLIGWAVTNSLPEIPTYKQSATLNHASVLKPDGEFTADAHFGIELTSDEIEEARSGNSWLWFFGNLQYLDFLGNQREARFCWRFASRDGGSAYHFLSDGNPPDAYRSNR